MKVKRFPSIARGSFRLNEWVRPPRRGLTLHGQSLRAAIEKPPFEGAFLLFGGGRKSKTSPSSTEIISSGSFLFQFKKDPPDVIGG